MNKKNSIKHFLAGILCCVMLINLIFSQIGLASEDNTNKNYSINYANFQFLSTSDAGYIPNGNIDSKMVIEKDGHILVDIFWICNKMGLNLEQKISKEGFISEVKEKENYYIQEMFKGYQSVFENTKEGMEFKISKENSYFRIYFRENSASAYAYSPYMGDIKVQLGTEIIKTINEEQVETYWVPLVMFLNLFDSYYQIDNNNIINIYPYVTTVVDILHKNNLNDYFFDVTKDSGLSRFDIFIAGTYNDFYITFKKMFKSIVDSNAWIERGDNSLYYGEIMATQLSTYSTNELIKLNRQNILVSNFFSIYSEEVVNWSEKIFNAAVDDAKTLLESAENIYYNSPSGFSRFDEYNKALSKATKAVKDASATSKLYEGFKMSTDIAPLAITAYIKYITINNEIGRVEQQYVDAIKEYINAVEKYCNNYMDIIEKSAINNFTYIKNLNEKVKLYDGGKNNIFENEEYINAVIEEVIKSQLPNIQSDFQEYFFNLNSDLLLKFKEVSFGWDMLEEISDSIFDGAFSSLNALECSLYTQVLESDSIVIIDELKMEMCSDSDNIEKYLETYRQLELIRLKSFYLVRQDIIDFYQTQKSSPYYEIGLSDIFKECEELCELMAILVSGTTGVTQNSMDNIYGRCKDTNQKLIDSGAILKEKPITSYEAFYSYLKNEIVPNVGLSPLEQVAFYKDYRSGSKVYVDSKNIGLISTYIGDINYDGVEEMIVFYTKQENDERLSMSAAVLLYFDLYIINNGEVSFFRNVGSIYGNWYAFVDYYQEMEIRIKEYNKHTYMFISNDERMENSFSYYDLTNLNDILYVNYYKWYSGSDRSEYGYEKIVNNKTEELLNVDKTVDYSNPDIIGNYSSEEELNNEIQKELDVIGLGKDIELNSQKILDWTYREEGDLLTIKAIDYTDIRNNLEIN